jgi:hypothetical protein
MDDVKAIAEGLSERVAGGAGVDPEVARWTEPV